MEKKKILRNRIVAVSMCMVMLCAALFANTMETKAEEDWSAFNVSITTNDSVAAGKSVTFKVSITNTTDKSLKLSGIYTWYYRDNNNSEKYPGESFGTLKDSQGKVVTDSNMGNITLSSKETKTYTLSGKIPNVWDKNSAITVVVLSGDNYCGQAEYFGKTATTAAKSTIKGTKLSKVRAGKKRVSVKWKKQTKGTTGYQIQYSVKKNFTGSKIKTVKGNKKTSVTIKKLKSKKTYYVRIRTYKQTSGGKIYSPWSKAKKVKIK